MKLLIVRIALGLSLSCSVSFAQAPERKPNVVLVMTDDQGYGDVGAHGNSMIKTPNMDRLRAESVRLTDFHVDPTCSPTRSALMSGRYSTRTGVSYNRLWAFYRRSHGGSFDTLFKKGHGDWVGGFWDGRARRLAQGMEGYNKGRAVQ